MNRRFNAVISEFTDTLEIYSIDESFFRLPALPSGLGDVEMAQRVRAAVKRSVGLPTRIGLGPTRTLSKVANALAKASEKVWNGVVDLHDEGLRRQLFAAWPVEEVWGIGPAMASGCGRSAFARPPIWRPCRRRSPGMSGQSCWSGSCAS